jgi:hypothetical protein
MIYPYASVQWQIMWSWRCGVQAEADDCRLSRRSCGPEAGDRCKECGPEKALIAGLIHCDCSPLQVGMLPEELERVCLA